MSRYAVCIARTTSARAARTASPDLAPTRAGEPTEPDAGSLADTAYKALRAQIVRLDLRPGALVSEDELQARTGIGRTPIREAVQRLTRDQLVRVLPRRGVMVTTIELSDLALLSESRSMLEPYVHRLAALRGDERHWSAMAAALDRADGMGDAASWTDLLDADRICHEQVWAASGNRYLTQTLDMLYTQSERLWHQYVREVSDVRSALTDHRRILDALRARDGDRAADLMTSHVHDFENEVRGALDRWLTPNRVAG